MHRTKLYEKYLTEEKQLREIGEQISRSLTIGEGYTCIKYVSIENFP